ncbi:MAG: PAS domain S-box protein [Planctomycetes bacterium]|nr:PAS domain S-box protein [Planctomycetota bacterium]MCB9934325.1 PAS domain S-box protein [Planctomycetota bacterium]
MSAVRKTELVLPALAALIAIVTVCGWFFQIEWMVRPGKFSAVMQLTTALSVLLCSVAVWGVAGRRRRLVLACGGCVVAICTLTLIANYADIEHIFLDTLLVSPFTEDHVSSRGRMSSASAFSFLFIATGAMLLLRPSLWQRLGASVLGTLALGYATFAFTGYFGNLLVGFGWGILTGMSVMTAVCALLLALGVIRHAWRELSETLRSPISVVAVVVSFGVSAAVVALAMYLEVRETEVIRAQGSAEVEQLASEVALETNQSRKAMERMALRIEQNPVFASESWHADARAYVKDIPGMVLAVWVKRGGEFEYVSEAGRNDDRIYVESVVKTASSQAGVRLTDRISFLHGPVLLPEGRKGFLIVAAIDQRGANEGLALALIDADRYLRRFIPEKAWNEFEFELSSPGGSILEQQKAQTLEEAAFDARSDFRVGGESWDITISPTVSYVANARSRIAESILLAGLILANLLGLSVQLGRTARANAERLTDSMNQLEEREEKLANLFASVLDAVLIVDANGRIEEVNESAASMFRGTREQLVGKGVDSLVVQSGGLPDLLVSKVRTSRMEDLAGSQSEGRGRMLDGNEFPATVAISAFKTAEGRKFAWVIRDITQRVKAAEEREKLLKDVERSNVELQRAVTHAEENAARFEALVASAPDATILVNENGTIVEFNRRAVSLFGWTRDEAIGQKVEILLPEHLREAHVGQRTAYAASPDIRSMVAGRELAGVNKDGDSVPVEVSLSPLSFDGRPMVVASVRDITERRRAQQAIVMSEQRLRQVNKELESIVYVASHDLRSPLVNLQGFSRQMADSVSRLNELLSNGALKEELREEVTPLLREDIPEALGYIDSSTRKMDRLIKGLLRLSRLGRSVLHPSVVDMNALMSEVVGAMQFVINEREVDVKVEPLPPCYMDPDQLSQVCSNLLDNAIKYRSPDRPAEIVVSGREVEGMVEYTFSDNGLGIAKNHLAVIFEVFHRLNPKDGIDGDGLGLAAVRRILERNGGDIRVDSEQGKGSRFVITVPAQPVRRVGAATTGNSSHDSNRT